MKQQNYFGFEPVFPATLTGHTHERNFQILTSVCVWGEDVCLGYCAASVLATVPRVPAETQLSRVCILLLVLRLADIVPH